MRLSEFGTEGRCIICGDATRLGGEWLGRGGHLIICNDEDCARALIHTAYDALTDIDDYRNILYASEWRRITDEPHEIKKRHCNGKCERVRR
jgi:hypothetical protein